MLRTLLALAVAGPDLPRSRERLFRSPHHRVGDETFAIIENIMTRISRPVVAGASVALILLTLPRPTLLAAQSAPTQASGETLSDEAADPATFDEVCSVCHETNLVDGPLKTPAEWDDTINAMKSYGATATDEQLARVRSYLLRTHGKVNVNTAPAKDLAPVLDISARIAEAVVKAREANGPFKTLDDLKNVQGVDPVKIDARKSRFVF